MRPLIRAVIWLSLAGPAAAAEPSAAPGVAQALESGKAAPPAPSKGTPPAAVQAEKPDGNRIAPENLEFKGVLEVADKTRLYLSDPVAGFNEWIEVGKTAGGIEVVGYDSAKTQATLRVNGKVLTLGLHLPAVVSGPQIVASTAAAMSAPAGTNAGAASGNGTPAADAVQAPIPQTKDELDAQEARMLVSDLLEISQIQAKAYREKKAAEDAAK